MTVRADLLARIDAHLKQAEMSARTFSLLVSRDHRWLARFRNGQATLQSIERAERVLDGKVTKPLASRADRLAQPERVPA
jgi:hypothetical protein